MEKPVFAFRFKRIAGILQEAFADIVSKQLQVIAHDIMIPQQGAFAEQRTALLSGNLVLALMSTEDFEVVEKTLNAHRLRQRERRLEKAAATSKPN